MEASTRMDTGSRGRVSVLVLDFDGVVTRLPVDWQRARREVSRVLGRPVASLTRLLASLWGTEEYFLASRVLERFEREAAERAAPFPGVEPALQLARGHGSEVYLATLQPRAVVEPFLRRHSLLGYFHGIVTRDDHPGKEEMLRTILARTRAPPSGLLLVDDNPAYAEACSRLGARFLHLENSAEEPRLLEALRRVLGP